MDRTNCFLLFAALFVVQRFDLAAQLLQRHFELGPRVEIAVAVGSPGSSRVTWDVCLPEYMRFTFDADIFSVDHTRGQLLQFFWLFPLMVTYASNPPCKAGSVIVNYFDIGLSPGLAFCDNRSDRFLIPDPIFVSATAYSSIRRHFNDHDVRWEDRAPVAFWRGTTTGHPLDPKTGWRSLPRIVLCEIARSNGSLVDAGISAIAQVDDAVRDEIEASGLMRPFVPSIQFNRYKYQIDIDGNTNSWPGLYQKLLTGSPVLKVQSPVGHKQWYYDRMRPWIHYVPVAADMSDLMEKMEWLRSHDHEARAIGEQGRSLANALDFEGELKRAGRTICAALRFFGGKPEVELHFGAGKTGLGSLTHGWYPPESDGVSASGQLSELELERPVAQQDFVGSFELSVAADTPERAVQQVTIAANGEVLRHVLVPDRRTYHCYLSRSTIMSADALTITLLHPDATCTASASRPLDERTLSVMLHKLELTPLGVYTAGRRARQLPGVSLPASRGLNEKHDLLGPDVWLPPDASPMHVLTHHGTILFADWTCGQVRHGDLETSPRNVLFAVAGGGGYLLHIAPDGQRYTIYFAGECDGVDNVALPSPSVAAHSLRVVQVVGAPLASFSLARGGLFLCAESDGRVTLSRKRPGPWERFSLLQPGVSEGCIDPR